MLLQGGNLPTNYPPSCMLNVHYKDVSPNDSSFQAMFPHILFRFVKHAIIRPVLQGRALFRLYKQFIKQLPHAYLSNQFIIVHWPMLPVPLGLKGHSPCSWITSNRVSKVRMPQDGRYFILEIAALGYISYTQKKQMYFTHRFNAQTNYLLHAMCKLPSLPPGGLPHRMLHSCFCIGYCIFDGMLHVAF